MNRNGTVYTVLFGFLFTFVFVLPLSLTDSLTRPIVDRNQEISEAKGILTALGVDWGGRDPAEVLDREVTRRKVSSDRVLYSWGNDPDLRLAEVISGSGLWGTITIALGWKPSEQILSGMAVLSQNETPGLGGRISESWFQAQFQDEKIGPDGLTMNREGRFSGDPDHENSSVDAVTGATRTSDSILGIVNEGIRRLRSAAGGP